MIKLTQPINILVQRRASIGDVIMTTGIVRELKRQYGANANIDVATDYAEIYRNNPHIRNVFPVDQIPPVNNRYDIYHNLDDAYELNPYTNYLDAYFYRVFGSANKHDKTVELFDTDEDKTPIDGKYIVLNLRNLHLQAKNIIATTTAVMPFNTYPRRLSAQRQAIRGLFSTGAGFSVCNRQEVVGHYVLLRRA